VFYREDADEWAYDGVIQKNMTLCVESYIGRDDGHEGVKLEQQVLIGPNGPELLMDFPWEEQLL
jgi:Xaa-Pro aminopeptidase